MNLEKALKEADSIRHAVLYGYAARKEVEAFDVLLDAARRFAYLTSPETIEKACHGKWGIWWKTMSEEAKHTERQDMKRSLESVLRSVEEDDTSKDRDSSQIREVSAIGEVSEEGE